MTEMRFLMFTHLDSGRKVAVNIMLVRTIEALSAIGERAAGTRIELQPVHGSLRSVFVEVAEDFNLVLSRLNMVAK